MRPLFRPVLYSFLAYCLYISGLEKLGFLGPDEPRYADVARAMAHFGDYITPHLYGAPWFEKPPLYYWLTAFLFHFNLSEVTARLPSAIAAASFLGFWYWFAQRFYGETAAKLGCMILASTAGWIGFARAAATDMLLATTLAVSLGLLALWLWEDNPKGLYGFYALLGVATLAKGPLAVALAGIVVVAYLAHRREWHKIPDMLLSPAVALFAVIAVPWYVLCYARNGYPFIQEFFIKHNLERLVSTAAIGHGQPFWFYLPVLPAALFPWTPTLLLPLRDLFQRGRSRTMRDPQRIFLLYWSALPLLFFSISENKLPGYLLPILPPVTLWIAVCLADLLQSSVKGGEAKPAVSHWASATIALSGILLLSAPLIFIVLPEALATGLRQALHDLRGLALWQQIARGPAPLGGWLVLVGVIVIAFVLLKRGAPLSATFATVVATAWVVSLLATYLSPAINRVASVRTVAQRTLSYGIAPDQLAVFYLHRNQVYGLGYYLGALPPEWVPEQKLQQIEFVAARDDIRIDTLYPGARELSLFPGQHLRLWQLGTVAPPAVLPASMPRN